MSSVRNYCRIIVVLAVAAAAYAAETRCFGHSLPFPDKEIKFIKTYGPFVMTDDQNDVSYRADEKCEAGKELVVVKTCYNDEQKPVVIFYTHYSGIIHRPGELIGLVNTTVDLYCYEDREWDEKRERERPPVESYES